MKKNKRLRRKVSVSAPGKLMLFGEHAVVYGNPCVVTAVDQRMRVKASLRKDNLIVVNAPDVGVGNFSIQVSQLGRRFPKEVAFMLTTVRNFYNKYKIGSGITLTSKSSFSRLFGFGSSSAVTVCVAKALSEVFDVKVSNKDLFDMSYKAVLDVQGVGSGFDIASAIWGGTLYFVGGGRKILPLQISDLPIVVGYTGVKADTASLIRQVAGLYKKERNRVGKIFISIKAIVNEAVNLLENDNFKELGRLMNKNQKLLESLGVSSKKLDSLIGAANGAGAFGAKLLGAGGGDCMIAITTPEGRRVVERAIGKAGGKVLEVKTNAEGVRIENI